jgi:hypothetical protein
MLVLAHVLSMKTTLAGFDLLLQRAPIKTLLGNVGTTLFAGNQRLVFRGWSSALQALQIVIRQKALRRALASIRLAAHADKCQEKR